MESLPIEHELRKVLKAMRNKKRLVMEIDYHDNALNGDTREDIERLFERCAQAGIDAILISTSWAGRAEYHSKILPLYRGEELLKDSPRATDIVHSFDSLAAAVEFGKKYKVKVYPYLRMYDEYWPGFCDNRIDAMDHGWWESRCGWFKFKGWPCYSNPEVREYKLSIVREIASYGVDGIFLFMTRSHSPYVNPYRQRHLFGYNPSIADEYLKRYGVDIRKFDYMETQACSEGPYAKTPFINQIKYIGAAEFNLAKWHEIKAEGNYTFIREARHILGKDAYLGIECSHYACPGFIEPDTDSPAMFVMDPVLLAREGTINEWIICDNWRDKDFEKILLPTFQEVRDAGVDINLWLNDVFSSTGGHTTQGASLDEVEGYLRRFFDSRLTSATIHEAAFLGLGIYSPEQVKTFWDMVTKLANR